MEFARNGICKETVLQAQVAGREKLCTQIKLLYDVQEKKKRENRFQKKEKGKKKNGKNFAFRKKIMTYNVNQQ